MRACTTVSPFHIQSLAGPAGGLSWLPTRVLGLSTWEPGKIGESCGGGGAAGPLPCRTHRHGAARTIATKQGAALLERLGTRYRKKSHAGTDTGLSPGGQLAGQGDRHSLYISRGSAPLDSCSTLCRV